MKKLQVFLFFGIFFTFNSQARIFTVSNVTGSVAMFTSAQQAVDSAKVGDTVFVHVSSTSYGSVSIKRKIVLLGEGGKPNYSGASSLFGGISIDTLSGVPVSGTIVLGIASGGLIIADKIKGVTIKNCYINSTTNLFGTGHIIVNNILTYPYVYLGSNITFSNNIVSYSILAGTNCVIGNCIFIFDGVATIGSPTFSNLFNCTIVNNLIIHSGKTIGAGIGSSFSKNIQAATDLPAGNFTGKQPVNIFSESTISASMTAPQITTAA